MRAPKSAHCVRSFSTAARALGALACLLIGASGATRAASFDCARAADAFERKICADPGLSAADSDLAASFDAALALSLDPADLRSQQRDWRTQTGGTARTNEDLAAAYAERRNALDETLARLRGMESGRTIEAARAALDCLPVLVDGSDHTCAAIGYADIGAVEGRAFSYAAYQYAPTEIGYRGYQRIVVFERLASGLLRVVLAPDANPSLAPDKPRLVHAGARLLLRIPRRESGTAHGNVERLFVWRDGRWRDVDVASWLDDELAPRLPAGLSVVQGVYPDYVALRAAAPLMRDQDDIECPGGGRIDIALAWRGDALALKNFRFVKAGECGKPLGAR